MELIHEESIEEFIARIELLKRKFGRFIFKCRTFYGYYLHKMEWLIEAKEVFKEFDVTESKFQLWLSKQTEFVQDKYLSHHRKWDEFKKEAVKDLEKQDEIIEREKLKPSSITTNSLKSQQDKMTMTSSETSCTNEIESKLSIKSDGEGLSSSSCNSTSRKSYQLDNLKNVELQQMNLPTINQANTKKCNSNTKKCNVCLESHQVYTCDSYLSKTSRGRYAVVKKLRLCRNCLRPGHKVINCKNEKRCKKCNMKHHTTLHYTKSSETNDRTDTPSVKIVNTKIRSLIPVPIKDCKLQEMSTVRILIPDAKANWQSIEAIIDTASNKNKLKLGVHKHRMINNSTERNVADVKKLSHELKLNQMKSGRLLNSQQRILSTKNFVYKESSRDKREMSIDKKLNYASVKSRWQSVESNLTLFINKDK
jgi:hypothetical protein